METRKHFRMNVNLEIISQVAQNSSQNFSLAKGENFKIKVVDISKIGMGIVSKHFLPSGLIIEFQLDGAPFGLQGVMKIKAEVRYCRYLKGSEHRCGVEFVEMLPKYRSAIEKFISTNERRKDARLKLSD